MARPPLTLGKLISRQANNIEETPEGNLSTPSLEARGETYTPPSSISSSYATSASYADFAISASHEIIKEVSSSHADFADTASYVNPLQQDVLLTGSLNISGSLDISMPTGSVFEIHEPDTDQPNRLQFSYSNGDPVLEIGSRSNQGYLHLRKGFTGTGFKIGSDASFEVNGTTEFLMSSTTFQPNTTNSKNLGVTNRRFKDVFLYSGAKLGWSANTVADLVSFQHVAGTNTLQATGSSDVTLDVKGDLNVSTNITASGNVSSSAVSTASFGTYLGDGSQLTGIEAGTNLTQSVFVTQNGDDTTGTIGNMSKPFATLESASQAATTGSTIFVYPGLYTVEANFNLAKPGVDYYFHPNTTVSKSTAGDMFDLTTFPTSEVGFNVFGYGDFILGSSAGSLLNSSTGVTFDYTFQARDIQSDSSTIIVDNFTNTDFTANWEFRNMSGSNSSGFAQSQNIYNGVLNLTCDSIITKGPCISTVNGYRVANVKAKLLKSIKNFALLWYGSATNSPSGLSLIVDEAIGVGGDNSDLAYRFTSNGDIDIVGQTTGIQFGQSGGGNAFNGVCNHLGRCIHLGVEGLSVAGIYNGSHVSRVDMDGDGIININWVITPGVTNDYIK